MAGWFDFGVLFDGYLNRMMSVWMQSCFPVYKYAMKSTRLDLPESLRWLVSFE